MKTYKLLFSLLLLNSSAYADGVKKNITITAKINDSIFVSKPDGSTWYDTEELYAKDYKQKDFESNDLKVKVWTTNNQFDISLIQPLTISRADGLELQNVTVKFAGQPINVDKKTTVKQTTSSETGFENTYTLKISAQAPVSTSTEGTVNGSYSGDLVMMFEPTI